MLAPALTPRTYSSATARQPLGVGLWGLWGYDIVESHVTVMISFSMANDRFPAEAIWPNGHAKPNLVHRGVSHKRRPGKKRMRIGISPA